MRAITLWQPWASLIGLGLKHYETRSWPTSYRGKLLIHAARRNYAQDALVLAKKAYEIDKAVATALPLPTGAIVAIADLTQCSEMTWLPAVNPPWYQINIWEQTQLERAVGDWSDGRFAWKLENIKALPQPVPCRGKQGLWIPTSEVIARVTLPTGDEDVKNDEQQKASR